MGMGGKHANQFSPRKIRLRKKKRQRSRDFYDPIIPDIDFYALRDGPSPGADIEALREQWTQLGRKWFSQPGWIAANPGRRPWAFWHFEWTAEDHPEAGHCRVEAEAVLLFADEWERKLIYDQNIVAQQLEAQANHKDAGVG